MLSQEDRILKLLLPGKPVHMSKLNAIAFRYGARLSDLRKKGYKIETIQNGVGNFSYLLVG